MIGAAHARTSAHAVYCRQGDGRSPVGRAAPDRVKRDTARSPCARGSGGMPGTGLGRGSPRSAAAVPRDSHDTRARRAQRAQECWCDRRYSVRPGEDRERKCLARCVARGKWPPAPSGCRPLLRTGCRSAVRRSAHPRDPHNQRRRREKTTPQPPLRPASLPIAVTPRQAFLRRRQRAVRTPPDGDSSARRTQDVGQINPGSRL
jgi:hypothetical protein